MNERDQRTIQIALISILLLGFSPINFLTAQTDVKTLEVTGTIEPHCAVHGIRPFYQQEFTPPFSRGEGPARTEFFIRCNSQTNFQTYRLPSLARVLTNGRMSASDFWGDQFGFWGGGVSSDVHWLQIDSRKDGSPVSDRSRGLEKSRETVILNLRNN